MMKLFTPACVQIINSFYKKLRPFSIGNNVLILSTDILQNRESNFVHHK